MAAVMTVLFVYYVQTSITDVDVSTQTYLGYFTWAAPLIVVLVITAGAVVNLRDRRAVVLSLAAMVAAGAVVAAVVPQSQDNQFDPPAKYMGVPQLPHLVRTMAAASHGRSIVVNIDGGSWPDAVGVVAYGDRTGVRACVTGLAKWGIVFRSQSVCTPAEVQTGVSFWFYAPSHAVPRGQVLVGRTAETVITRQLPS